MSKRKRKRSPSLTNNSNEPTTKKRKLSENTNLMESLIPKIQKICRYKVSKIKHIKQCLYELLKLSPKQRESIIKKAECNNPLCRHWCCNMDQIKSLLTMNNGLSSSSSTYSFLFERFKECNDCDLIPLSKQNKIKTDIIKKFADPSKRGEIYRPYILTIQLNDYSQCNKDWRYRDWRWKKHDIICYEGAIDSLQNFTSDTFLNTFKDFNFFRFQKKITSIDNNDGSFYRWKYKDKYSECGQDEVLYLLQSMKKEKGSQTFLLLMFFMSAYFKNFLFDAVKSAVQYSSISDISDINTELNDDVLSIIMSFMMNNHESLYKVFEDKHLIKQLLKEAVDADESWQDILVDIIEKDQELAELYEPRMKTYHDSEKLNILNLTMYGKTLNIKKMKEWLKYSVECHHYGIYEIILKKHCELKISVFKHIFYQISFKHIKDKKIKWFKCMENKMIHLKQILNKNERKRFEKLCDKWMSGIVI